jgi:CheY-like chemotaxis protein
VNSARVILYAEDEEDDAYLLERAFSRAEISNQLVVVPGGKDIINYLSGLGEYANRARYPLPCLVLLDLNMPGTSGVEVLKWIRSTPSTTTLPVIMLTSSSQDSDVHRSYILGANGYLVKPSNLEGLVVMAKSIKDFWLAQNRGDTWMHITSTGQINNKPPAGQ